MWVDLSEGAILAILEIRNVKEKKKACDYVKVVRACNSRQLLHVLVCNCLLIRYIFVKKQLFL